MKTLNDAVRDYNLSSRNNEKFKEKIERLYPGYPELPPFTPCEQENIVWYLNDKKNWGCWLWNKYKKPMLIPMSLSEGVKLAKKTDARQQNDHGIYKSPIPLHEAKVPNIWRAHMAWYVDENGFGQYVYYYRIKLDDGKYIGKKILITRVTQNVLFLNPYNI